MRNCGLVLGDVKLYRSIRANSSGSALNRGFAAVFVHAPYKRGAPGWFENGAVEMRWSGALHARGAKEVGFALTQPASSQAPASAEAAPAIRTSGAAACGRLRATA